MMTHAPLARRIGACMTLGIVLSALLPATGALAAEEPRFELRPHCSEEDRAKDACKSFNVRDPQSFQTEILKAGDTLDMDLLIHNPGNAVITRFRAWMGYDPTIFSGSLLEIDENFPTIDPSETLFSDTDGYIKAAATSAAGAQGKTIVAARVTLKVVKTPIGNTVISFYDATKKADSRTAIIVKVNGQEQNISTGAQSYLFVRLQTGSATSSAPATSSASSAAANSSATSDAASSVSSAGSEASSSDQMSSSSSSEAQQPVDNLAFMLLQVQGLRVTTEGSSAFLAWNQMNAGNLLGYNVYYGTVSGQYIQRRSVEKTNTTLTIRNLPVGTRYFFAVRGVDANNQESDFSQEVAVTVGNPDTSTSPLTGSVGDLGPGGKNPGTNGTVAGDTGPASTALLFIVLSSMAGLLLAFRRQLTARNIPLA